MFIKLFSYIFGNKNKKKINYFYDIIDKIVSLKKVFSKYPDFIIKNNTDIYRNILCSNNNIYNNNYILPYIFTNIYEAIKRIFGIELFDVQLLGALSLYSGYIIEMKTGEGKTITSTLPAYFYSLFNKGVHIITINDYLAKRDWTNNTKLFNFLGLSVGLNLSGMSLIEKKRSYLCDITYGTSSEFGFDYLRDNMVFSKNDKVQRKKLYYAILDEIDSILIDESRTPLIISSSDNNVNNIYKKINKIIFDLKPIYKESFNYRISDGDFIINKKNNQVYLTENGFINLEKLFVSHNVVSENEIFYTSKNINIINYLICLLKAYYIYKKNIDYLVDNNKVIIIDKNTGRMVPDRRWSDGIHQALEIKENVKVNNENKISAYITFQNYFRIYEKICGMTGTAITEASEFNLIYNLDIIVIPTNKPMIRIDYDDLVYLTEKEKIYSIIKDIKSKHIKGQPILVGTTSIEKSEYLSNLLFKFGIKNNVLNAKYHMFEADIISQAGKLGAVTIATNMAGRGTDIILGGNLNKKIYKINKKNINKINIIKSKWKIDHDLIISLGGLYIIGTERHESRRLDNQLRGRSGRQGDPGSSRFYISMDDSLMNIFSSNRVIYYMRKLGIKYGECIEHPWISSSIENAQKKIENYNFEVRKYLLNYDNIYNDQRKIIYFERNKILYLKNIYKCICKYIKNIVNNFLFLYINNKILFKKYYNYFGIKILKIWLVNNDFVEIYNFILKKVVNFFNISKKKIEKKILLKLQKNIALKTLDFFWTEYLYIIDNLKESISLCIYFQKNPRQEYKIKSFNIFMSMLDNYYYEVIRKLLNLPIKYNKLCKIINLYL